MKSIGMMTCHTPIPQYIPHYIGEFFYTFSPLSPHPIFGTKTPSVLIIRYLTKIIIFWHAYCDIIYRTRK